MKKYLMLIPVLAFLSCNEGNERTETALMDLEALPEYTLVKEASDALQPPSESTYEEKIIKNGFLELEVDDLVNAEDQLKKVNSRYKVKILNLEQRNSYDRNIIFIQAKVNPDSLSAYLDNVKKIGIAVQRFQISQENITSTYIDLMARLKNRKALEDRYLELLQKANKVEDMLKIERELSNIRQEIESMEGQKKYYDRQVAQSTVNIELFEKVNQYNNNLAKSFWGKVGDSLDKGWELLLTFTLFLIRIWPFALLLILGIFLIKRIKKKRAITN